MCLLGNSDTKDPVMPPEYAQMREPDRGAVDQSGRRTKDRMRAGTQTVLTSGSGVTEAAPTMKKTLLGQ